MPCPLSRIRISTFPSFLRTVILITPCRSSGILCSAFFNRLINTRLICSLSANIRIPSSTSHSNSSVLFLKSNEQLRTNSSTSKVSLCASDILAKSEKAEAMAAILSICSINMPETALKRSLNFSVSSICKERSINWIFNFIGVSGFLIS